MKKLLTSIAALSLGVSPVCAQTSNPNDDNATHHSEVSIETRMFSGGNVHFQGSANVQSHGTRYLFSALTFDNTGPRKIEGSDRRSHVTLYGISAQRALRSFPSARGQLRVIPEAGVEFVGDWKSTDVSSGATAKSTEPIAAIALPFSYSGNEGTRAWLAPSIVLFDGSLDVSAGGTTPGYGTTVALEFGAERALNQTWTASAKGLGLIKGYNSVDSITGARDKKWGYEARLRYLKPDTQWFATLILSNLAGTTMASRVIASEDNSVGLAVGKRF